jgi:hypothetical protein
MLSFNVSKQHILVHPALRQDGEARSDMCIMEPFQLQKFDTEVPHIDDSRG